MTKFSAKRDLERLEGQGQLLDSVAIVEPRPDRLRVVEPAAAAHLLQIAAGGEGAARARQDRDPGAAVVLEPVERGEQRQDHVFVRNRVAKLRPVQRQGDDALIAGVIEDGFRHLDLLSNFEE